MSQRKFGNPPAPTMTRRNLVCYAAGGAAVGTFLLSGWGLPTLAQAFNASFQQVQWVVLAYLLAITTLIVSVGRLGDKFEFDDRHGG